MSSRTIWGEKLFFPTDVALLERRMFKSTDSIYKRVICDKYVDKILSFLDVYLTDSNHHDSL